MDNLSRKDQLWLWLNGVIGHHDGEYDSKDQHHAQWIEQAPEESQDAALIARLQFPHGEIINQLAVAQQLAQVRYQRVTVSATDVRLM